MGMRDELPDAVLDVLSANSIAEYATLSAAGYPIDTPILCFPDEDFGRFNLSTGLAYPIKAERARRNPKVGLLMRAGPDAPVVSIAGVAAVRDADLQANALRYLSESAPAMGDNPPWGLVRQAIWYWTRLLVAVAPARVLWWDNEAAMDGAPSRWDADPTTVFPASDPAPAGEGSKAPAWPQPPWQELARRALAKPVAAHLSVVDEEGYPLPIRASSVSLTDEGFTLRAPRGVPWPLAGKASLTVAGVETFLGEVRADGDDLAMRVERALPLLPLVDDVSEIWEPRPDTLTQLMARLQHEAARRGQALPTIPLDRPQPTASCRRGMDRIREAQDMLS